MFVKQINMNKALELLAKGIEVMVLVPGDKEGNWGDMMPSTLQNMLAGCMFFRQEPAMEVELFDEPPLLEQKESNPVGVPKEDAGAADGPAVDSGPKRVKIDTGKIMALRKAGWDLRKIADEMRISVSTVHKYVKMMEEKTEKFGGGVV